MKQHLLVALSVFCCLFVSAQNYGTRAFCDPPHCSPAICPEIWESFCVVQGEAGGAKYTIHADSMRYTFGGQTVYLSWQSFKVDTIWGYPPGFSWFTNQPDDQIDTGEVLCLEFQGLTHFDTGSFTVFVKTSGQYSPQNVVFPDTQMFTIYVAGFGQPCQIMASSPVLNAAHFTMRLDRNKLLVEDMAEAGKLLLYDLSGRLLRSAPAMPGEKNSLDVTGLDGMLLVNLQTSNRSITRKIYKPSGQ